MSRTTLRCHAVITPGDTSPAGIHPDLFGVEQ